MVDKLILHNSISPDGSLTQFAPHMGFHYQIASEYHPEAHLIGSKTITS
jgi:2,5-diamino-6-(ribosylamino)-4(3H)-pyrimidinone 5'-phosphate reductase